MWLCTWALIIPIYYPSMIFRIHQTYLISIFLLMTQIFCKNRSLFDLESTANDKLKNSHNYILVMCTEAVTKH